MTAKTVLMDQMSWPEFRDHAARNPVVFIPCGATEQHGPHLPLSVDALMSAAVAREVAEEVGGIVAPFVAPAAGLVGDEPAASFDSGGDPSGFVAGVFFIFTTLVGDAVSGRSLAGGISCPSLPL